MISQVFSPKLCNVHAMNDKLSLWLLRLDAIFSAEQSGAEPISSSGGRDAAFTVRQLR